MRSRVARPPPPILAKGGPGPTLLDSTPGEPMNTERLLREVESRLARLAEADRQEVLDAVREEIARERRRVDPELTVEAERERRVEAETFREVLEAINRQARLEDTIEEVLKQVGRVVVFDFAALALVEAGGGFRIIAERGMPEGQS